MAGSLIRDGAPQASLDAFDAPLGRGFHVAQLAALPLWIAALAGLPLAGLLAGLLAVGAGWGLKALLITRAAFTRGAAISHAPVRGRGIGLPIEALHRRV
ncbi:Phenylacetyl-CoA:acceptor oxidoreductase (fragment) [Candidatus Terasakiella magnetica]